jgi:hypothetical protein
MPIPNNTVVPSERTIENLSNHHILLDLQDPKAWFFVPTQKEELVRGYDASLQNAKLLVFQYKRVYLNKSSLRIEIDTNQHNTLSTRFKKLVNCQYVFYGFSTYKNYQEISTDYSSAPPVQFIDKMIFVDAHQIPIGCKSVNYSSSFGVKPSVGHRKYAAQIPHISGPTMINRIKGCTAGLKNGTLREILEQEGDYINKKQKGRLKSIFSMFIWYRNGSDKNNKRS